MKLASKLLTLTIVAMSLTGCFRTNTNPRDPYENFNRNVFKLNNCIDHTLYRPITKVYSAITPPPLKKGITNFFNNVNEPDVMLNDLLQGKIRYAFIGLARLIVNSTLGIAGLFDVASHAGLPKHTNDFGKTFAFYSQNKKSSYLVLPFYGPTTFRDGVALPFSLSFIANPISYVAGNTITYSSVALYYINIRSKLLPYDKMIDQSFDPYAAVRNAYLAHRDANVISNAENGDYEPGKVEKERSLDDIVASSQADKKEDAPAVDDFTFGDESKAKPKHKRPKAKAH